MAVRVSFPSLLLALLASLAFFLLAIPGHTRGQGSHPPDLEGIRRLLDQGEYERAEALARTELRRSEERFGEESLEVAQVLDLMIEVLGMQDRIGETRELAGRTIAIREKLLGADHPELASSLARLGDLYARGHRFEEARPLLERALAIQESILEADDPWLASSLGRMGAFLAQSGSYGEARIYLERQRDILRADPEGNGRELAKNAYNLGRVLRMMGRYEEAEEAYQESLTLTEKSYGSGHALLAWPLNGLAAVYDDTGEYTRSRWFYERALAIADSTLPPDHSFTASCLNNLGYLLVKIGDYSSAETTYERSLELARSAHEVDEVFVASTLTNLAESYRLMGDPSRAEPLCLEALGIRERVLGPNHIAVSTSLIALGNLSLELGDAEGAEVSFRRAATIATESLGPEDPDVSLALTGLADAQKQQGRVTEALETYKRALEVGEKSLGPEHPKLAAVWVPMGELLARTGDRKAALEAALRGEEIARAHVGLTAVALAEREALGYSETRVRGLDLALHLASQGVDSDARRATWDALVRSRAMVLDAMAARRRAWAESSDPEVHRRTLALANASRDLARLFVQGPGSDSPADYLNRLDDATRRREEAERALSEFSSSFRLDRAKAQVGLSDVEAHLPTGAALVAFALYDRIAGIDPAAPGEKERSSGGSRHARSPVPSYLAFILRAGDPRPVAVPLGPAEWVDSLVTRWIGEAGGASLLAGAPGGKAESICREIARPIRLAVWEPLTSHLSGTDRVFVVPDGALHLLNFSALPAGEDRYLIETGPLFHLLSAERDLVPAGRDADPGHGLMVVGGPDFDRVGQLPSRLLASEGMSDVLTQAETDLLRGTSDPCLDPQSLYFEPLPASSEEARLVASLWLEKERTLQSVSPDRGDGGRAKAGVMELVGADADEGTFKAQAPGKQILHLATHGFFLDASCGNVVPGMRGVGGISPRKMPGSKVRVANPLLLAGLALSGANRRSEAEPGQEDGILTAEEVASLDLEGVEWVVLSACETGLGEIAAGEGVLGLRRAFQVAGARTLITSLWSVDDRLAREWMTTLYQSRWRAGEGTAEAIRRASRKALERARQEHQTGHPFYWAGFVAAGDWR